MSCLHCEVGFHQECEKPIETELIITDIPMKVWSCCCPPESELVSSVRGGPVKEDDEVTDIESTGRKRAAVAYPIANGAICEWANLKNAGGGIVSIIGCNNNSASDRHHGPDKSTLNNSSGNVHRICATCHNRWHTCNDKYYGNRPKDGSAYLPIQRPFKEHDSETRATLKEILDNEIQWSLRGKSKTESGQETFGSSEDSENEQEQGEAIS